MDHQPRLHTDRPLRTRTSTLDIYIKLAQYPILADRIRLLMRQELFKRGIISEEAFEAEVERKAIESQEREGIYDAFEKEPASVWQMRKDRIRDYHTDFYFGYNLPNELFNQLVLQVLQDQPAKIAEMRDLTFNPELAPWTMLFEQGEIYENLPPAEREKVDHHLEEIKVVLIKGMISDQLPYIGVAKKIFTIADLQEIFRRRIGHGKIGGKAAGMLLAWKILQQQNSDLGPDMSQQVNIPESYFLATDVIYAFRAKNRLDRFMNEKYRSLEEIRANYPSVIREHMAAEFPSKLIEQLSTVLRSMGDRPVIVRSSSLLEDNFGFSFAGKYSSYFLPNQGNHEENLEDLLDAVRRIYASTTNPDALLYRKRHNLLDYDERMAIMIQAVRGTTYKNFYFPTMAGVGFSQNPFRWNPKIRREEGFLRLVWGLGTRAVNRVDRDYPRLLALSHPRLRPETTAKGIRQYSQHFIDVIDMEENEFRTLPVDEVLAPDYPGLRFIASEDKGDYLQRIVSVGSRNEQEYVLTFDYLTQDRKFIKLMRTALMRLEKVYKTPVDMEFTVEVIPGTPYPDYVLHILQCRPLTMRQEKEQTQIPTDVPEEDVLIRACKLIPSGRVDGIRYIVFVDPVRYREVPDMTMKLELGRAVSRLNKILEDESFILLGPGRWGSENIDLGVRVTYADIYNTKVLVELSVPGESGTPELSYGTHFFQDLVEGGIHSLPLHLEEKKAFFNWEFFRDSPNSLSDLSAQDAELGDYLRVIDVEKVTRGRRLNVVMNDREDRALGYLSQGEWERHGNGEGRVGSF